MLDTAGAELGQDRFSVDGGISWQEGRLPFHLTSGVPVAPLEATAHGIGTDIEQDLGLLWRLVAAQRPSPRVILELGTRQAISTATLQHAAQTVGAVCITCDPADCRQYLKDLPRTIYFRAPAEMVFDLNIVPRVDVLFVDTDPHSYEQTTLWLDTWVAKKMTPGGLVVFHDIMARDIDGAPRPDIRVAPAVRDWVRHANSYTREDQETRPEVVYRNGYRWIEVDGTGGLGVLLCP